MNKKVIYLFLSCSMVIALLLASCGPAVTEEEVAAEEEDKDIPVEEVA